MKRFAIILLIPSLLLASGCRDGSSRSASERPESDGQGVPAIVLAERIEPGGPLGKGPRVTGRSEAEQIGQCFS